MGFVPSMLRVVACCGRSRRSHLEDSGPSQLAEHVVRDDGVEAAADGHGVRRAQCLRGVDRRRQRAVDRQRRVQEDVPAALNSIRVPPAIVLIDRT